MHDIYKSTPQDELDKARIQIDKKDRILAMLTEGLKEVIFFLILIFKEA